MADLPRNDAGAAMNDHVHLCQTPEVASRLRDLGYAAHSWKTDCDPARYAGKSLILVGAHGCPAGALDIALISQVAADAGARAVRVLEYAVAPYIVPGFNLSRKSLPHDLLARRIVEAAADQEPLRRRVPDILELDIATQFAGEPPAQRWLVGGPEGGGGLLPDAAPILLAGRGGIGKTRAATELAFLMGTWDGRAPAPRWWGQAIGKAGPSVVITYEEHVDTMHRTIHALCRHHGIDLEQGRRRVIVMSMIDPRISGEPLIAPHPKTKALAPTAEYNRLTRQLRKLREHHGELGVIVLDHAIRAFPVDTNAVTDANMAMGLMGRWAGEFDCGVVTLAHTKKVVIHARMGDEEILQAVVGSIGWVSSVRATMVMWQLEEEREAEIAEALDDREWSCPSMRCNFGCGPGPSDQAAAGVIWSVEPSSSWGASSSAMPSTCMYRCWSCQSSLASSSTAPTSRVIDSSEGKPTTSARRLISRLRRSSGLVECSLVRWRMGKAM